MCCLVWMLFIREFVYLTAKDIYISIEYQKSLSNFTLNDMNMFERIHAFAPDRFIRHYTVD